MNGNFYNQAAFNTQQARNAQYPFIVNQVQVWPTMEKSAGAIRHKFTKAEDELLKSLVEKYGETNWVVISSQMKTRSPRQCRERYKNYLSPKIKNGPWTPEEEELLIQKVKELGQRWANIALYFEPRSDVNVKNHWTAMMNRQAKERNMMIKKSISGLIQDNNFNMLQNSNMLQNQQMMMAASVFQAQTHPSYMMGLTPQQMMQMNYMTQQHQALQMQQQQQQQALQMQQHQQQALAQQQQQPKRSVPQCLPQQIPQPPQPEPQPTEQKNQPCPIFTPFEKHQQQTSEWFDQDIPEIFSDSNDFNPNDEYMVWE